MPVMLQNQQYNANTGLNLKFLNNSLHAYEMCAHAQHVAAVNPKVTSLLALTLSRFLVAALSNYEASKSTNDSP